MKKRKAMVISLYVLALLALILIPVLLVAGPTPDGVVVMPLAKMLRLS